MKNLLAKLAVMGLGSCYELTISAAYRLSHYVNPYFWIP